MPTRSPIQEALWQRLSPVTRQDDGTFEATITFDRDFIGFAGHFPGNPVVPGVCEIAAVELLAQMIACNANLRIRSILQLKFRAPLLPDDCATFAVKLQEQEDGNLLATANISTPQTANLAKIKLALK